MTARASRLTCALAVGFFLLGPVGWLPAAESLPGSYSASRGDLTARLPAQNLSDRTAQHGLSTNVVWILLAGFLVMFMQTGFAMLEMGLCRAKNAAQMVGMNLMVYPLGAIAFWAYGFALGWGNWSNGPAPPGWSSSLGPGLAILNRGLGIATHSGGAYAYGLAGAKGFFLNGIEDASLLAMFFFMMVFMAITAAIPTGPMAERWNWRNFCLYGLWIALPFGLLANWVWGGGWLAQAGLNWKLGHGAVDFAGSGVVHALGGIIGLAGTMVLGPRLGKFIGGRPQPLAGHNLPMVVIGTLILAFGWFGINPGSTLAGSDLRIATVAVNTLLAGATGAVAAMLVLGVLRMKPDPTMMCNGMLAGLVAVTAGCAFVDSWAAALTGAIAGVLAVLGVFFFERRGVDDPVGAVSVHGVSGLWGLVAVGLFANGKYGAGWNGVVRHQFIAKFGSDGVRGLFYGDASQLWAQLLNAAVIAVFGFAMAYLWFKLSDRVVPLRVSRQCELEGLDGPQMGSLGYPEFTLVRR